MKKVRIHSDGFGSDAVVIDEDGNKIDGIVAATVHIEAREPNRVDLEIMMPGVNLQAHIDTIQFVCPCCNETLEHQCDGNTLGGNATFQCPESHIENGIQRFCARRAPHTGTRHTDNTGFSWGPGTV